GFPVDHLWVVVGKGKTQEVIEAPAGALVEVGLPTGHPELPHGAPVYCSSSQAVKRRYRHERPRPGVYRVGAPFDGEAELTPAALTATATAKGVTATATLPGPFAPARDAAGVAEAVRSALARCGETGLELAGLTWRNDGGLFVPASRLNGLR